MSKLDSEIVVAACAYWAALKELQAVAEQAGMMDFSPDLDAASEKELMEFFLKKNTEIHNLAASEVAVVGEHHAKLLQLVERFMRESVVQ